MISALLIAIAAICNAVMDRVENDVAFNASVFKRMNKRFWLKSESWRFARKVFGWKFDAWHVSKSAMIVLLCEAAILYSPVLPWWWADLILFGIVWNTMFVLFYKRIFKA